MSIEYAYEIIKVDEAARCMEIVYSAAGHQTMYIGARLPYEGETLEQIVAMHSPVAYWEEQARPVVLPQVGSSGTVAPVTPGPADAPSAPVTFQVTEVVV